MTDSARIFASSRLCISHVCGCIVGTRSLCTQVPRVSGNLAVSRALGDFGLAPFVSGEPEITGPRHVDGLGAIVVACDGVYDVLDDARTAAVVAFQAASHGPQRAAEALRDAAYATGSTDNISVVVVNLAALCPT